MRMRLRTTVLLFLVTILSMYLYFFDRNYSVRGLGRPTATRRRVLKEAEVKLSEQNPLFLRQLELQIDNESRVIFATYAPPEHFSVDNESFADRNRRFRRIWSWADKAINVHELYPDTTDESTVINALRHARFVNVDMLDIGFYESGTAEKWIVTLEGGQKAVVKLSLEPELKGDMKVNSGCNKGFEMPWAEIAAYHLHRILGFRNSPYATGRLINIRDEVLPVASPAVTKSIVVKMNGEACLFIKCYKCHNFTEICTKNGIFEASIVYWLPRHLMLYTYPPKYMPYSTTNIELWGNLSFNNHTYCNHVKQKPPYNQMYYFDDLMDFAALDTIINHYDSKHYVIDDNSDATGLTIRLDHGRAFCSHDHDNFAVLLAPIHQCCRIRWTTWYNLHEASTDGLLEHLLRERLAKDPIAPVLKDVWYKALERRISKVLAVVEKCKQEVGHEALFSS